MAGRSHCGIRYDDDMHAGRIESALMRVVVVVVVIVMRSEQTERPQKHDQNHFRNIIFDIEWVHSFARAESNKILFLCHASIMNWMGYLLLLCTTRKNQLLS